MSVTSRARPPRRAILLADPSAGYRLTRSRGWASEAAALDAVRLVDTNVASAAVRDLAGCFALGARGFAVVRGGVAHASDGTDRCWREVVALGARDLARVRCNPFRVLPCIPTAIDDAGSVQLDPPVLPEATQPAEDLTRLTTLRDALPNAAEWSSGRQRETLLAALLESPRALVLGTAVSYAEIELLLLLLPAPLRLELTFHSHALSTPASPIPRLVVAPDAAARAFDADDVTWTHRLPDTRASIGPRARRVAGELLALLDAPDRLVEAHVVYEQYAERERPGAQPLLDEAETLLRFVGMRRCRDGGDATGALHVLGDSLVAHGDTVHPEPRWVFDLMRASFSPAAIGEVVSAGFPDGAPAVSAYAIEQFALQRRARPEDFAAFARPIHDAATSVLLVRDDEVNGRLRTLLVLLAAARADAPAMVAALRVPLDAALVDRLGGADAWASGYDLVADALLAFLDTDTTDGIEMAIEMLGRLAPELPAGRDRLRVIDLALDFARLGVRRLPAQDWRDAVRLADAAMQLCQTITFSDRVSLDGRPDSQHYHELLSRAMSTAAQFDVSRYPDADVFFGFLGADAARSRLARREVEHRGDVLVRAVDERIRRAAPAKHPSSESRVPPPDSRLPTPVSPLPSPPSRFSIGGKAGEGRREVGGGRGEVGGGRGETGGGRWGSGAAEAVHWSLALLDRVRRGELDAQYVSLAVRLLERDGGAAWLMAYVEAHPAIAPALLAHAKPRELLGATELTALGAAALAATLDAARTKRDAGDVEPLCQQLRSAGVVLHAANVRRTVEEPLRRLAGTLRQDSLRPVEMHLSMLNRSLALILAPDALAIVRPLLRARPESVAPAPRHRPGDRASRAGWLSRMVRRAAAAPPAVAEGPDRRARRDIEREADPVPAVASEASAPASRGRKRRRRDRTAGIALGVAILSMSIVLLSSEVGRRALLEFGARGGRPADADAATEAAVATPPVVAPMTRLEQARASARAQNWSEVVDLLSADTLDRSSSDAFGWDSLLASAALRQAGELPREDAGRRRLLELARDRASAALETARATGTGAELLRLIRAEACLSGDLVCENADVLVDLALAVESTDPEIADRADALIRSRW